MMTKISPILSAFGPGDEPHFHVPLWAIFDSDWYRERYRHAVIEMTGSLPDDRGLYEFWRKDGARYAHSPNRYFDEIWYRRAHFDVENGIRMGVFDSGFQHYCETGHCGRSCHWLFSESDYFRLNPDITPALLREQGYANGYDHYLAVGQSERRVSSAFFVPDLLRAEIFQNRRPLDSDDGEFSRLLLSRDVTDLRTSWYFDPVWYLERYGDVGSQIARGEYTSPLHHYLSNENPTAYCPNPFFDEAFYLGRYDDVKQQVAARKLRNGYEHFVQCGLYEGRSPCEGIDLPPVALRGDLPDWKAICDNAFVTHIKQAGAEFVSEVVEERPDVPSLRQLARLQALRGESLVPLLARNPLDFRYIGRPDLSVVVNAPDTFLNLIQTLASLHESNCGAMQVIVLSGSARDETANIARYAHGIEVIASGRAGLSEGWQKAMASVSASHVLLIDAGATLFLGALSAAMTRLEQDETIAVAPQNLGLDLRVVEAGLTVTRDGSCLSHGAGEEAFSPIVDFVRPCDGSGGGALLCQLSVLRRISVADGELLTLKNRVHVWASLALSLCQVMRSGRIIYEPKFVVRIPEREVFPAPLALQERQVLRRHFSDVLRGNLSHKPVFFGTMHKQVRWGRRILVLTRTIPLEKSAQRARLRSLSQALVVLGFQVTVFVLGDETQQHQSSRAMLPDEVEFHVGSLEALTRLIRQRPRGFDQTWIMGGHTLNDVFALLNDESSYLPDDSVILDLRRLEAVEARFDLCKVGLVRDAEHESTFENALASEVMNAWFCQEIVVADAQQAKVLHQAGVSGVTVLGDDLPVQDGKDFEHRRDLLFAAQPAMVTGYNLTFLKWFVRSVMTRVNRHSPEPIQLVLACDTTQSSHLSVITQHQNVAPLIEGQADFSDLAARCRIMIAPDEGEGCVSLERLMAGASGLPVVIGGDVPLAGALQTRLDPEQFAEAIITLYQDRQTWQRLSDEAKQQAKAMSLVFRNTLAALLGQGMVKEEMRD